LLTGFGQSGLNEASITARRSRTVGARQEGRDHG
jgi:hypothetical protein